MELVSHYRDGGGSTTECLRDSPGALRGFEPFHAGGELLKECPTSADAEPSMGFSEVAGGSKTSKKPNGPYWKQLL